MFKDLKEKFINLIDSRLFTLIVVFIVLFSILLHRVFALQIVEGASYLDNFQLTIKKERTIPSTRGQIFDRNGTLLAYDELAYSVTIEDNMVYESSKNKNRELNTTIHNLIGIIEKNGDNIVNNFNIILDKNGGFAFAVEGRQLQRFLADVYGHAKIEDLKIKEEKSTPQDVIDYLAGQKRFAVGGYTDKEEKNFQVGFGYEKDELLKIVTIRYEMSLNGYQKFILTTVAKSVSDKTVAVIMENIENLQGVGIAEDTIRVYKDSKYMSHITGYTGKISQEEYEELSMNNKNYQFTSMIGKAGIEQVMEEDLQGSRGNVEFFVDNMGRVVEYLSRTEPIAGNDIYLSIDLNLQKVAYNILEQKLAGILLANIINEKEIDTENVTSTTVRIPIDDVYFALFDNNIIDFNHFSETDAKPYEKSVQAKFIQKQNSVIAQLKEELMSIGTPYNALTKEMQVYEYFVVTLLRESGLGLMPSSAIDVTDETYLAWKNETISLKEYLNHAIANNWIDITKIDLENKYSDAEEVYEKFIEYILENLKTNKEFSKKLYKYMIRESSLSGQAVCMLLYEQNIIQGTGTDKAELENGRITPFKFMTDKIENLEITPAQLALDPCTGSFVMANKQGEVLACVTYPGYDTNRLANSIDADYYSQLTNDKSLPLYDYATQQRTAPGSTLKMVIAMAALEERVISIGDGVRCVGTWETIPPPVNCWINPGAHGVLSMAGAIQHSCNYYFYEMGYRLSMDSMGIYDEKKGIKTIQKYADLFGLSETSGIEIVENDPQISDEFPITSSIGQGNHNYTTAGLARYITTVANSGTCYDLSLIDKVTDASGNTLKDYTPKVRNSIDVSSSTWATIHKGMGAVIENSKVFKDWNYDIKVAGKTGTAQEDKRRANHALFVGYAPYENPEIAVAARIANGYTSSNTAEVARDIIKYYYELEEEDKLVTGTASETDASIARD